MYYTREEGVSPQRKSFDTTYFEKYFPIYYCLHFVFCHVGLGPYLCSTNHVEINDVYVCIYNSLWGRGQGLGHPGGRRMYALYELSLTNKNNIIMKIVSSQNIKLTAVIIGCTKINSYITRDCFQRFQF